MNCGMDDPLRVDYRQMIKKGPSKPQSYLQVEPLTHGHLNNLQYIEMVDRETAATKIQSLFRSYKERRFAEMAAKIRAFEEAKALAIQEVKTNLIAEFRTREASSGMGRMKWDAQVRLQQGKLRALGEVVSRADTVMIMMDEALRRATDEIEQRFREIQSKEEFGYFDIEVQGPVVDDPSKKRDILELFGLSHWFDNLEIEDQMRDIHTPRPDDSSDDGSDDDEVHNEQSALITLSSEEIIETLEGNYTYDPKKKGENKLQREFRHAMAFPSPEIQHLVARLRAIDSCFTVYKVMKFLSETPSKRLLMLMVENLNLERLAFELRNHFKLARNHTHIATVLKSICHSDLEFGILPEEIKRVQYACEGTLSRMVQFNIRNMVEDYNKRVESRLQSITTLLEDNEIIQEEISHNSLLERRFAKEYSHLQQEFMKLRREYHTLSLSIQEIERRRISLENLNVFRAGLDIVVEVQNDDRKNWMGRMTYALSINEDSEREKEVKYTELVGVCREFIDTASHDAMTIIREYYLPNMQKTIPIYEESDVEGRSSVCGRGIYGKKSFFEANNISYRVFCDHDGIFNGSDECSAKAANNERLFSLQYAACHVKSLHVPLVVTIDYHGFRVLAQSRAPTTKVSFNEKGEVNVSSGDLVHGVVNRGDMFLNRDKLLQSLLSQTARIFNLSDHNCKGFKDISGSNTNCSAEIKIYRGVDGDFYMQDFWVAFPPEVPECTPHFLRSSRDQSIYWRRLRPEFCRNFHSPLSPDACSTIVYHTFDQRSQYEAVHTANMHMINHVIPEFVDYLVQRNYTLQLSEGLGLNVSNELHVRGVSVRHIGLIRSKLWHELPGKVSLYNNERYIRCSHDVRNDVRHGDIVRLGELSFNVIETNKRKIEHDRIPIDRKYKGHPYQNVSAKSGTTANETNCESLRILFLTEMITRTIKHLIRGSLRQYAKRTKGISVIFLRTIVCEYLNIISGASDDTERVLQELVYHGIRERFGHAAVSVHEQFSLFSSLKFCIPYAIHRLMSMLNVRVSLLTLAEFHQRPLGFQFCVSDILEILPVIRHNMSALTSAEATLAAMKANTASENTYREQILTDSPLLFLQLYERKGSRVAENVGSLGESAQGAYSKGCELYLPGPIVGDSFSKSVGFKPDSKSFITVRFQEKLIPQDQTSHFTVELFAKCSTSKEIKRVAYLCGRFGLVVNRENFWVFHYIFGIHEGKYSICMRLYLMTSCSCNTCSSMRF